MPKAELASFTLTAKGKRWLSRGENWVFATDILQQPEQAVPNGSLVHVRAEGGAYLATAFYSEHSQMKLRLITRNANDYPDLAFWERRFRYALAYRQQVLAKADLLACRLIFGDVDQFPGLIIDRYGDRLVSQCSCFGLEQCKDELYPMFIRVLAEAGIEIRAICERNAFAARSQEGLPTYEGYLPAYCSSDFDFAPQVQIVENGINYEVDVLAGQKTGFFLDQKYNRRALAQVARGLKVLDCFSHTGSFALNALAGGAQAATVVDISPTAIKQAQRNFALNPGAEAAFITADVFHLLTALREHRPGPDWDLARARAPYQLIILDPPAFAKLRSAKAAALRGYRELNLAALKLLPRGGYLATASCSRNLAEAEFVAILQEAAQSAQRELRLVYRGQQAPDHPIAFAAGASDYLKFYLFQVV